MRTLPGDDVAIYSGNFSWAFALLAGFFMVALFYSVVGLALAVTGALLASWLQPIAVVVQLQTSRGGTPISRPAQAELSRTPPGKSTPTAEAESDGAISDLQVVSTNALHDTFK